MKKGIWSGRSICHYGKKIRKLSVNVVTEKESLLKRGIISESDVEMDQHANAAVQSAINRAKICKKPIAKYDSATQKAYIEYGDGVKSMSIRKPIVLVLADPNGSGKSTIMQYFDKVGEYTNADDVVVATGMNNFEESERRSIPVK